MGLTRNQFCRILAPQGKAAWLSSIEHLLGHEFKRDPPLRVPDSAYLGDSPETLGQEPERACKSSDRGASRLKTFVWVPSGAPEAQGPPADGLGDVRARAPRSTIPKCTLYT